MRSHDLGDERIQMLYEVAGRFVIIGECGLNQRTNVGVGHVSRIASTP